MHYSSRTDIVELHEAFARRRAEARDAWDDLPDAAMNWRPAPGRWSIAECIDHLCLTGFAWADHLNPILSRAMSRQIQEDRAHRPGPIGSWAIRMMERPARPLKTASLFNPGRGEYLRDDVLNAFDALGESWEATLRRASLVDLSRLWVGSPAAALARMPAGTWLYALSAHEDRHLDQARRVQAEPGFAGA